MEIRNKFGIKENDKDWWDMEEGKNEVDVERKERRKETRGEMTICWDEGKTAEREW